MKSMRFIYALAILLSIAFSQTQSARAELVYEDDLESTSSGKMVESAAPITKEPVKSEEGRVEERKELSKAEMLRRQRVREELKNEDLLSQKLEELRLKDELKRTEKLASENLSTESAVAKEVQAAPVVEQKVGSANQQTQQVPQLQTDAVNPVANQVMFNPNGTPLKGTSELSVKDASEKEEEANQRVGVSVRGGMSSINSSLYNVESKYSFGIGVEVSVNEYVGFTGGWTYSKFTLGASSSILTMPYSFPYQQYQQKLELSDNVFDVGIRGSILKNTNRVRPFVGAGVAYRKGFINYDQKTRDYIRQYDALGAQDINISGFAGYIETGLDFKLTKNISLYGMFRYFNTFSSSQSGPINPNAFAAPYGGYSGSFGYTSDIRNQAGSELSKNNYYQLMGGVTVNF